MDLNSLNNQPFTEADKARILMAVAVQSAFDIGLSSKTMAEAVHWVNTADALEVRAYASMALRMREALRQYDARKPPVDQPPAHSSGRFGPVCKCQACRVVRGEK